MLGVLRTLRMPDASKRTARELMATGDRWKSWLTGMLWVLLAQSACAHASVALLMEEPYGDFGAANPTGHAWGLPSG
jgi:hypothetical protein